MSAVLSPISPVRMRREPSDAALTPWFPNEWGITGMQGAVLGLIVEGKTGKEIARELGISHKTVEAHLARARQKMGAANALQAALMWDRHFRKMSTPPASRVPNRWYLAGPMTGIHQMNFPAFHRYAIRLRAEGLEVINPAEINLDQQMSWSDCLRADIVVLVTCEGIALMPDWKFSKGATLEHHIAERLGMKVRMLGLLP